MNKTEAIKIGELYIKLSSILAEIESYKEIENQLKTDDGVWGSCTIHFKGAQGESRIKDIRMSASVIKDQANITLRHLTTEREELEEEINGLSNRKV